MSGGGTSGPANVDPRFQYRAHLEPKGGNRQSIFSSEISYIQPTNALEDVVRQIDFDITTKRPVLFEYNTRLIVRGQFQTKTNAVGANWEPCGAADYAKVIVEPNWWEKMLRSSGELYNNHQLIKTSDEPNYVPFHLNTFLYWAMEPTLKKILCPEPCHPGNGIPKEAKSWTFEENGEWKKYAEQIFSGAGKQLRFSWTPLFAFPFYQGSNWIFDKVPPGPLPINHLGKFTYRLTFRDNLEDIFRKKAGNTNSYRFALSKCYLMMEEVRLNPALERSLYQTSKKVLSFPGVTKLAQAETVATGVYTHNVRFDNVYMPEGIFIFAMSKAVTGGTYKFADLAPAFGPLFAKHNVAEVSVEFGGIKMALTQPNMFQVNDDALDVKRMLDHMGMRSPFGLGTNPDRFTLATIKDGSDATDFPHIYFNLCAGSAGNERCVPALTEDANVVTKMSDLFLQLKFGNQGAPQDLVYIIYLYYTDVNMTLDMKNRRFVCPYDLR